MELAEKTEQLQSLEITNTMTNQELQAVAKESERLRLLMSTEQRHLRDSLQQKRDLNAQLRQSLIEIRKDGDKKELLLQKQIKELREKCISLENEKEKDRKELNKHQHKEFSISAAKNEVFIVY